MSNEFEFPGFDIHRLDVVMVDDDGMQRDETLRVFDVDDYETLAQEAIHLADWFREHGPNEEERELYDVAVQLVTFYNMAPAIDRRRQRAFNVDQIHRYESLRQLVEMSGAEKQGRIARLLNSAGTTLAETRELFEIATFEQFAIEVPFDREAYEAFRDNLLEEMVGIREELMEMADQTVRNELRKRLTDPGASVDTKQEARRILETDDVFEECPELYEAWDRIETMLMKEAIKIEERRSEPYEQVVADADALLSEVATICHEEDCVVARAEADRIIRETLNITDATDCLRRVIQVGEEHPNTLEKESSELFADAIRSRDPLELWDSLTWVRENLINRNECIRLLMREAEMVLHFLLELALQERYVKMRQHMSRAERRLFQFMYRRSPELNGRIPAIDEIGRSFVIGLDAENAELFLEVIGYGGTPEKNRELSHRWKSYLRLYPFWCELMQFDDREEKRRRSTLYITREHEDRLADTSNGHDPSLLLPRSLVDSSVDSVDSLAQRYCTDTQQRYLLLAFVDRQSHTEIAERFGVSQQAVSKSIGLAMKRIREGLVADQLVELAGNHRLVDGMPTEPRGLLNSPQKGFEAR